MCKQESDQSFHIGNKDQYMRVIPNPMLILLFSMIRGSPMLHEFCFSSLFVPIHE